MKETDTEAIKVEKKAVKRRIRRVETDNELALRQLRDAWKQIAFGDSSIQVSNKAPYQITTTNK